MSLQRYRQPLQSPLDFKQSPTEIQAFSELPKARTGHISTFIRFLWERFGHRQVGLALMKTEGVPRVPLSEHFNIGNMRMLNESFAEHVASGGACCSTCADGRVPFSCTLAQPQSGNASCPPYHGLPTNLYLYNGEYVCCYQSPYAYKDGQHMAAVRKWQNNLTPQQLGDKKDLDPAHEELMNRARRVFGPDYQTKKQIAKTIITS